MKYRAEYDAKTDRYRVFIDDRPANQYELAKMQHQLMDWTLVVIKRTESLNCDHTIDLKDGRLATIRSWLASQDEERYKELSFTATAN